jgi:hypothetical protein
VNILPTAVWYPAHPMPVTAITKAEAMPTINRPFDSTRLCD